jgi:hypothetical protein
MDMKVEEKGIAERPTGLGRSGGPYGPRSFNAFKVWKEYEKKRDRGELRAGAAQRAREAEKAKTIKYEGVELRVDKDGKPVLAEGKKLVGGESPLLPQKRVLGFEGAGLEGERRFMQLKVCFPRPFLDEVKKRCPYEPNTCLGSAGRSSAGRVCPAAGRGNRGCCQLPRASFR